MENVVFHLDLSTFCIQPQFFSKKFVDLTWKPPVSMFCVCRGGKSKSDRLIAMFDIRASIFMVKSENRKSAVSRNWNVLHNWSYYCAQARRKVLRNFINQHKRLIESVRIIIIPVAMINEIRWKTTRETTIYINFTSYRNLSLRLFKKTRETRSRPERLEISEIEKGFELKLSKSWENDLAESSKARK